MNRPSLASFLALFAATALTACGSDDEPVAQSQEMLHQAKSCDDLLAKLKADALSQMNDQIDAMIEMVTAPDEIYWGSPEGNTGSGGATAGGGEDAGAGAGSNGGVSSPNSPSDFSETNNQVEGVDEADIVKTDGNFIYLLHGSDFSIVNAWPATDVGMSASVAIEGHPLEMFVHEGRAVVFSTVQGEAIYEAAGKEPYMDDAYGDYYEPGYWYGPSLTKITVLDLEGGAPSVLSERYFEGQYQSARRVGNAVRTVISGGGQLPGIQLYPDYDGYEYADYPETEEELIAAYESLRQKNAAKIRAATLDDFLPDQFEKKGGGVDEVAPACTTHYLPPEGTTEYGMTKIVALDLDSPTEVERTSILGATDTVYSNEDTLVLAARAWDHNDWGFTPTEEPVSLDWTYLHAFDISGQRLRPGYVGSAEVPGTINDQFSLDATKDQIRITTTETLASIDAWEQVNGLFVLKMGATGLSRMGEVRGLAPTETIFSTRFVGDRAYIVTFRQVDPLFVVDLSDGERPEVLAELKIPGFSEYMHPINGGTHLLTVGRDGTDDGVVEGVALQLFDVRDPRNPVLAHKHVFEDPYGYTEAAMNHKAFTFYNGWLAIPYESYGDGFETWSTTLQLFRIDTDSGIQPIGAIDHTSLFDIDPWTSCVSGSVRRGLFIEDYLYSISYGGMLVHDMADLTSPVATLDLTTPNTDGCMTYYD